MRVGVVFPQTEIGADPGAVREYAQAAESLGFDHILSYEHVLGANAASRPGWSGAYQLQDNFHEPFVLYGFLAGITQSIELATGILILPQRQTVLVAKQAAALDVLSQGRLRLGIGIGWNEVEYEALGENFRNRGRRSEEQIELMRRLWTEETVSFEGQWHKITDAGINPLPVQRPIPIWLGGSAEQTLKRVGYTADGWIPLFDLDDERRGLIEKMRGYAREAGRDPSSIGIESLVSIGKGSEADWLAEVQAWKDVGASHVSVNTMGAGLDSPQAHIDAIKRFKEVVSSAVREDSPNDR